MSPLFISCMPITGYAIICMRVLYVMLLHMFYAWMVRMDDKMVQHYLPPRPARATCM